MISGLVAIFVFAFCNAAGAMVLRARGFGLISFQRAAAPASRWRAPVARLFGPLGLYVVTCAFIAVTYRSLEVPTSKLEVVPGLPAAAAGLKTGDRVVQIAGAEVATFPEIKERVAAHGRATPVEVVVLRGGERVTATVTTDAEGHLGVRPSGETIEVTWGDAVVEALPFPFRALAALPRILSMLAGGQREAVLMGPVGTRPPEAHAGLITFVTAFAANLAFFWGPLTLLALVTQVVAWRRGELRAPR